MARVNIDQVSLPYLKEVNVPESGMDFSNIRLANGVFHILSETIAANCTGLPIPHAGTMISHRVAADKPALIFIPWYSGWGMYLRQLNGDATEYEPWKKFALS